MDQRRTVYFYVNKSLHILITKLSERKIKETKTQQKQGYRKKVNKKIILLLLEIYGFFDYSDSTF